MDLVAGRGMGAVSALFAAVDGGARLWEASGHLEGRAARRFYSWRAALRVAAGALAGRRRRPAVPAAAVRARHPGRPGRLPADARRLRRGGQRADGGFSGWLAAVVLAWRAAARSFPGWCCSPSSSPPAAVVVSLVLHVARARASRTARRRLAVAAARQPLSPAQTLEAFALQLWNLIRGAAPLQQPRDAELARRYVELLTDNLGQPGFRELLVVVHDLDARQDLVVAFLAEQHRARFFGGCSAAPSAARAAEVFDLAGVAREHALDVLAAALALPVATEPHLVHVRGRRAVARRDASAVRSARRAGAAARGGGRRRRRAGDPAHGGAAAGAAARAERRPRRPARPRRRAARRVRSGGAARRARAVRRPVRRPLRDPARAQPVGPFDFAGDYDERSDRTLHASPSWSTAATRTPTASSSSRSSAPAASGCSRSAR